MRPDEDGITLQIAKERYLHSQEEFREYEDLRARYYNSDVGQTLDAIAVLGTITVLPVVVIMVSLYIFAGAQMLAGPLHIADLLFFLAIVPVVGIMFVLLCSDRARLKRMRGIRLGWVLCLRHKNDRTNVVGRAFWLAVCSIPTYLVILVVCIHYGFIIW